MPLTSQQHTPKLMGEDDHSIKYGCAPEEYADDRETKEVDGVVVTMARRKSDGSMGVVSCEFKKPDFDKDKAGAWLAAQTFSVEPADLHTVKDVEIFSTGLWNGKQITDEDLNNIVNAYAATKTTVSPHLKLGHDDEQKILQADGLPAAGWVENLRKVGSKIVADFVDIPKKVYQLITNRAYRKVSCEIYNNLDIDGVTYPKMLGAVALLGADLPGVLNLSDILSLYVREPAGVSISKFAAPKSADIISLSSQETTREGDTMELDAYKAKLNQAEDEAKALKAKVDAANAEVEKFKKERDEAQAKVAAEAAKAKAAEVDAFVTALQADKLVTKDGAALVKDFLGEARETYTIGEKKDATRHDLFKEILKGAQAAGKVNFSDSTKDEVAADAKDLGAKVEKYAADNKVSYSAAYKAVTRGLKLDAKPLNHIEEA